MVFQFRENSKFAMLALDGIYSDLPDPEFQLSDGTWYAASARCRGPRNMERMDRLDTRRKPCRGRTWCYLPKRNRTNR